jgi:hypothetical protein
MAMAMKMRLGRSIGERIRGCLVSALVEPTLLMGVCLAYFLSPLFPWASA